MKKIVIALAAIAAMSSAASAGRFDRPVFADIRPSDAMHMTNTTKAMIVQMVKKPAKLSVAEQLQNEHSVNR